MINSSPIDINFFDLVHQLMSDSPYVSLTKMKQSIILRHHKETPKIKKKLKKMNRRLNKKR